LTRYVDLKADTNLLRIVSCVLHHSCVSLGTYQNFHRMMHLLNTQRWYATSLSVFNCYSM